MDRHKKQIKKENIKIITHDLIHIFEKEWGEVQPYLILAQVKVLIHLVTEVKVKKYKFYNTPRCKNKN